MGERDGEGMDRSKVWGSAIPGKHVKVEQNSIGKVSGSSKIRLKNVEVEQNPIGALLRSSKICLKKH